MNVAIFHHHLNRGGVTRVIGSQLAALHSLAGSTPIRVALFHGGRKSAWQELIPQQLEGLQLQTVELPALEYDACRSGASDRAPLADQIRAELARLEFVQSDTVLHVHNHSLGKNLSVVPAIRSLAQEGYRFLLQIHDFAEDFRPDNYARLREQIGGVAATYPLANQVHYGVINRRDQHLLARSMIDPDSIHYLPNPVSSESLLANHSDAKRAFCHRHALDCRLPLWLYPVRGIRRKNLGEAILLTLLASTPVQLALTLAPLNPAERPSYDGWKQLVNELRLPIVFEVGHDERVTLAENLSAADRIITTSVAEGFGLVFLESSQIGKPLLGRDLPEITADFKRAGLAWDSLYETLQIPIDCVPREDLRRRLVKIDQEVEDAFGQQGNSSQVDEYLDQLATQGGIDFAKLPASLQRELIVRVHRDPRARNQLVEANPDLTRILDGPAPGEFTRQQPVNRECIATQFSIARTGEQLQRVYRRLIEATPGDVVDHPNPAAILEGFLGRSQLYPLRIESGRAPQAEDWRQSLKRRVRSRLRPLMPLPTGVEPKLTRLKGIRAVLFDVYGTLLVSSSGDVGADPAYSMSTAATEAAEEDDFARWRPRLKHQIEAEHRELRAVGIPFPEIDIVEIWRAILGTTDEQPPLLQSSTGVLTTQEIRELAFDFELRNNPVWGMPGLTECLAGLSQRGLPLGIISNAQFYTPLVMEALAEASLDQLGFHASLNHFSYLIGRAKPDRFLYKLAAESLRSFDLSPADVLYVGNDMTKDMLPAKHIGFRTALFAGDARSLRCAGDVGPCRHDSVDVVLTHLDQLERVL